MTTVCKLARRASSGMSGFLDESARFVTGSSDGTLRIRSLETALELLWQRRERYGVSRVSSITAQDRIGVPVYNAVRPNACAHNLTVSTGKGTSATAALVSCLAEAYERHWAEPCQSEQSVLHAAEAHLQAEGLRYVPLNYALGHPVVRDPQHESFDWIECMNLSTNETTMLPTELVVAPLRSRFVNRGTDGIACGNSRAEAFIHAVLELVERDAVSFARFADRAKTIRIETLPTETQRLTIRLRNAGIRTTVVLCEAVLNIPVYFVILDDMLSGDPMLVCSGAGAHFEPSVALSRALTEAIQTRACVISGNREDLEPRFRSVRELGYERVRYSYVHWTDSLPTADFDNRRHSCLAVTAAATARALIGDMTDIGIELYARLLSPPRDPMSVVSVFGTGLESVEEEGQYVGPRLRQALRERWSRQDDVD